VQPWMTPLCSSPSWRSRYPCGRASPRRPSRQVDVRGSMRKRCPSSIHEIASYIGLLRQAHTLGLTDLAYPLAENLHVEAVTASKVEQLAD